MAIPNDSPTASPSPRPKGDQVLTAVCEVWTHPLGWELRLHVDREGFLMSSVTRSGAEMIARVEEWHAAMREKGWS
jgi:hypothetical protein